MSANTENTRKALKNISDFIRAEPTYVNITKAYKVSLDKTMTSSQTAYANTITLGHDLSLIFTSWKQIKKEDNDDIAQAKIRELILQIVLASDELEVLKKSSSQLNIAANEVMGELNSVENHLEKQLADENEAIKKIQKSLNDIAKEISKLNDELSGSSGFWEGFKTGISFGIYSGLRDKINKQKALRNLYTMDLQILNQTAQQTQRDYGTINQIKPALNSVNRLDSAIVSLENTMLALVTLAKQTKHDGERIVGNENEKIAEFFYRKFKKDMTALLEWENVFPV